MRQQTFPPTADDELRSAFARAHSIALDCGLAYLEVDAMLDVAPGTFRTMCAMAPPAHVAEGRVRVLADMLDYANKLLGSRTNVALWLRTPHPVMANRSPVAFLKEHPEHLRTARDALRGEWHLVVNGEGPPSGRAS